MTFTTLSGRPVHPFAFGAMQFGGKADEAAARGLYDACRAAGINHFDTAWAYNEGRSEETLGRFAAPERDDVFVATKAANGKTFTREVIDREFAESLGRLGMERVDLLYVHQWDPATPLEQPMEALAAHLDAGRTRHVGVSNFAAWQVMKAQRIAESMGFRIEVLQPMLNLVKRQAEVEILPMARDQDLAVFPYSPLGGGLLTGKYARGEAGRLKSDTMYARRYAPGEMHATAAALSELAAEAGVHPATLAVAWVARRPGVTGPIISARSVEQLEPSLAAIDFDMDDALADRISGLSRTPPPATDRLEEA